MFSQMLKINRLETQHKNSRGGSISTSSGEAVTESTMKFILLTAVLFCGLTSAQDVVAEDTVDTQSCFPDMCKFLKEFGAMTEKQSSMEARLKEAETQITELKKKDATKVAFTVGLGGGQVGPFSTATTLIYKTVKTNVGNAYNPVTGIFAAPVTGIYYFTFSYHAGGEHPVSLNLIKNNEVVVGVHDHRSSGDGADNGGNSAFLQLQQGDQVYMQLVANTHLYGHIAVTTFSGVLLYQL
ncbi:complement C1q-like protein 2 [Nothobranchius furzeri]|uniref:Complement C1q-like protein 2 n=1 Tax=Nothobranchius furzeri TaxID=105023 RepID=A0A9D3C5M3_NOTFU|nr:complement C1q-like protein 2 [Nothobranchius furzeri]